ncbi:replication protein A 70 kDa DNA-binding subunit A-like [Phragmites australis]|uniref:replication protein A 70 kDa DNA-binding subunit A-like n=1 Tax=Phragmites australis TaxID=29695 RepID=UPI002D77FACA|nr:replication protein A 70 kDa DNA-binding subunit A-like [Phragmites australis]
MITCSDPTTTGKIVVMRKITVERATPGFRVVRNPRMIRLNRRTEIAEVQNEPPDFLKYTFSLTAFPDLYQHTNKTDQFLDVIGQIILVSNTARVLTSQGKLQTKRIINMQDLSGNRIDLSLWGPRALEFNGESVYEIGQKNHIIAIFVGTPMKSYRGGPPFLSRTSACLWYINNFRNLSFGVNTTL